MRTRRSSLQRFLPVISIYASDVAFPALFLARHLYHPSSVNVTFFITRIAFPFENIAPGKFSESSLNQKMEASGSAVTAHVRFMVVLIRIEVFLRGEMNRGGTRNGIIKGQHETSRNTGIPPCKGSKFLASIPNPCVSLFITQMSRRNNV